LHDGQTEIGEIGQKFDPVQDPEAVKVETVQPVAQVQKSASEPVAVESCYGCVGAWADPP